MSKIMIDSKRSKRIEELFDWSHDGKECYSVRFKNMIDTIWVESKMEIYNLLNKTDDELREIADRQ